MHHSQQFQPFFDLDVGPGQKAAEFLFEITALFHLGLYPFDVELELNIRNNNIVLNIFDKGTNKSEMLYILTDKDLVV